MCHLLQWKGASVAVLCKIDSVHLKHDGQRKKFQMQKLKKRPQLQMQEAKKLCPACSISDEGYANPVTKWPSSRRRWEPLTYSHFLYSLRLIIWPDGKKPGLIDCTQRNWENSCSLCFLQVMRLIRGGGIITNFRGSFPALGDEACRQNILWKI